MRELPILMNGAMVRGPIVIGKSADCLAHPSALPGGALLGCDSLTVSMQEPTPSTKSKRTEDDRGTQCAPPRQEKGAGSCIDYRWTKEMHHA